MKAIYAGCALALVLTPSALAAHGKVGQWQATVQMGGMPAMPNMSNLPPQVQAQMRAHGVSMNAAGVTTKFCMTAADVAGDKPVFKQDAGCRTENVKVRGSSMSADVICTGTMNARGHIEFTWTSNEHYTAVQSMDMVQEGHPMHTSTSIDARWIAPVCIK